VRLVRVPFGSEIFLPYPSGKRFILDVEQIHFKIKSNPFTYMSPERGRGVKTTPSREILL